MKAILAVTCIFSAVVLISALSKQKCEAPYATPQCAPGSTLGDFYYYNNGTQKCEKEFSCPGPRNFPSEGQCRKECPYGIYANNG
uniref:Putative secreted salivary protein n=1 Tax=Ixodes scapularis TaxID=6945 RepID=Q4PMQ1_IXOSC|nr:putative secreted salivary protein [Ixodes scapularis]